MGTACSAYKEEEVMVVKYESGPSENSGVDGRITLKWIFEKLEGGMDWIDLAQDRDRWWALVNAVMNLRVP
jgi:hypothetical protein